MDHPRVDRLRMKQLTVSYRHPLEPWLHEPSCDERVRSEMVAARPLVKWLAETVGPVDAASDGLAPTPGVGALPARRREDATMVWLRWPRAPVAQLDRASVYGTEGREFESLRARY